MLLLQGIPASDSPDANVRVPEVQRQLGAARQPSDDPTNVSISCLWLTAKSAALRQKLSQVNARLEATQAWQQQLSRRPLAVAQSGPAPVRRPASNSENTSIKRLWLTAESAALHEKLAQVNARLKATQARQQQLSRRPPTDTQSPVTANQQQQHQSRVRQPPRPRQLRMQALLQLHPGFYLGHSPA